MLNCNKRKWIKFLILFFIGLYISLIFFLIIFFINYKSAKEIQPENQIKKEILNTEINQLMKEENEVPNIENNEVQVIENQYKANKWRIFIPKINLDAPILEGTNKEILRKAVGHFNNTSKWNGNVALAAHNRGYKYNFFAGLKMLEIGDEINYQKEEEIRKYVVIKKEKIKETDLSCLENTKENKLTLITCVENMPEYRLCIQAIENLV